ncbi:deazaflavin-dependent oxidoreductase (nitroreductase family) [Agromyces cerinus]|uniref:nitroreductase family deazaflavin-dependent oxidoreductase n=1 Tax=Agromyces cerinus TaxID=33878 RepID=UPI00195CD0D8|nr:nitroreductase family deazaflavin-dependent oxidoreductase [Agromyces cerinus]MBM7831698.1 deazaflavin-dependent oxidoreductase (nitroreductase family) [Agromyces cerinus]
MADSRRAQGPPRWAVRASEPLARALAGRRWVPLWGMIHHRGRRSENAYATPIALVPTTSRDVFLIGLPWGSKTNWARNVLAAGEATITWKGRDHRATAPRLIEPAEAAALSKPAFRAVVGRFPAAIVLTRSAEADGSSDVTGSGEGAPDR